MQPFSDGTGGGLPPLQGPGREGALFCHKSDCVRGTSTIVPAEHLPYSCGEATWNLTSVSFEEWKRRFRDRQGKERDCRWVAKEEKVNRCKRYADSCPETCDARAGAAAATT